MDQRISRACSKLVGTTYEKLDCWEAVVAFYREAFGLSLNTYYGLERPSREETQGLIKTNEGKFDKVEVPMAGDLILFKVMGFESHIGIYLDEQTFFHSTKGVGVAIDRFEKWKRKAVGFYRHRASGDAT